MTKLNNALGRQMPKALGAITRAARVPFLCAMSTLVLTASPNAQPLPSDHVPGQLLVKPHDGRQPEFLALLQHLDPTTQVRPAFPRISPRLRDDVGLARILLVTVNDGLEVPLHRKLTNAASLEWVELNTRQVRGTASSTPNDQFFTQQWALAQTNDIDMDMPEAWSALGTFQTGSNIVVAVLDSGFDLSTSLPDWSNILWANPDEIANGFDDDGNGYVDDTVGYDFVAGDSTPSDELGHGTNVASIIAARPNNTSLIAGISPAVRVMILRILNAQGVGSSYDAATALWYATTEGAHVINNSWGIGPVESPTITTAIQFAASNGVHVVCSAGNDGVTSAWPAQDPNVIAVAAVDSAGHRSVWNPMQSSNYGPWVDVSAGGTAISTIALGGVFEPSFSGTSAACPLVAAAVAVLASVNPTLTPTQMRSLLGQGAVSLDAINPGYTGQLGSGFVNVANSLALMPAPQGLVVTPEAVHFGSKGSSHAVLLTNGHSQTVSWYIPSGYPPSWASVSPPIGTLAAGASQPLTITVIRTGLQPGPYAGAIQFAAISSPASATLAISMNVIDALEISPAFLNFGTALTGLSASLSNLSGLPIPWSVATLPSWISLVPTSGNLPAQAFTSPMIHIDRTGLPPGDYSSTVTFVGGTGTTPASISLAMKVGGGGPTTVQTVTGDWGQSGIWTALGDVNSDGYSDVVVSSAIEQNTGSATVFSGWNGAVIWKWFGQAQFEEFGRSIATADIDGDSYVDVIVGSPNAAPSGKATVFSGQSGSILFTLTDPTATAPARFGVSVATAGDVDGDWRPDVIVGAPNDSPAGKVYAGSASVFSGANGTLLRKFTGQFAQDQFGYAVSSAGRFDADALDDVAVGARYAHKIAGSDEYGSVTVFRVMANLVQATIFGNAKGDEFGTSVTLVGDTNGNGSSEIVVGAPWAEVGVVVGVGTVHVLEGPSGAELWSGAGQAALDNFGQSVSGAGDVDADGVLDVVVGAAEDINGNANAGTARVFKGSTGLPLAVIVGSAPSAGLGFSVSGGGDINNDGFDDVSIGVVGPAGPSHVVAVSLHDLADSTIGALGMGCGAVVSPELSVPFAGIGSAIEVNVLNGGNGLAGGLFVSTVPPAPLPILHGCFLFIDPASMFLLAFFTTDSAGNWGITVPVPPWLQLVDVSMRAQAFVMQPGSFGLAATNGIEIALGYL